MVDRQKCTNCGGLGRVFTLPNPPADPTSEEGWEQCPACKGSKVQMADQHFEVHFRFKDEIEAREFMDRAAADPVVRSYGIRPVPPEDSLLDQIAKRMKP